MPRRTLTAAPFNTSKSHRPGKAATSDHVAPAMIREWSQEQRARIRFILTILALARDLTDLAGTPEMQVVAMIDQEGAR